MFKASFAMVATALFTVVTFYPGPARAETPGEFRPKPTLTPEEKVGATGVKVQPPDTLPKSRAPLPAPRRKPKLSQKPQPRLRGQDLVLNAGWELKEAPRTKGDGQSLSGPEVDTKDWYDATVPGTVLTTLVDQGVYPDPYYGLNNLGIPESLCRQDYWYRCEFDLPKAFAGRHLTLDFNGINYYAEVYLNGHYLGHITGAFIRGQFDVTRFVRGAGKNVLAVLIAPPPDPGHPSEQSVSFGPGDNGGTLCLDGPTFICTEGWDWIPGIRDRCSGIWQDVVLHASGPVVLSDPQVITRLPLPDTSRAEVTISVEARNLSDAPEQSTVQLAFEGVKAQQTVAVAPHETKVVLFAPENFHQLQVQNPRLWWPNGYGKPDLYHLQLRALDKHRRESDVRELRFGMREISYELGARSGDKIQRIEFRPTLARGGARVIDNRRETMHWRVDDKEMETQVGLWPEAEQSPAMKKLPDSPMGHFLVIKVNGRRIQCVGGNWGMDDAMKRISRERLEPYVRLHRDAHLTMVRNWCGQSTSEDFYDLCDEYGLLVWNDFWISTEAWNYNPLDEDLFLRNAGDCIKRFRNHPSIALWCPRNEGVPAERLNQGIDRLVREMDGTRYYQPSSRFINLRESGPWSNLPLQKYFTDLNHGFSTEMGASSIPSAEVLRTFLPEADLWPPGDVWAYHDLHSKGAGNRTALFEIITRRYGEPKGLEDLCRKAQLLNYETYRAIYEGFNSRLWHDTSGILVWMSHPSWPSVVWQFYTWDYDPVSSLFAAKKAAEHVHIQMNLPDCKIAVINHRAVPLQEITATATIFDLEGKPVQTRKQTLTAAPDACTDCFKLDWPAADAHLARLELRDKMGHLLSENFYWHATQEKQLQQLDSLSRVSLNGHVRVNSTKSGLRVRGVISNPTKTPVLSLRLTLRDPKSGKRILPAYYDENYFALLPGESREFVIESTAAPTRRPVVDLDGWNVEHSSLRP
jgi:Exo-beta-D-glucosaminidase Ig-fold domain/Glycosyl hydrolases family 2/Glycosyl hydrolases family 2, sugar binding domain/Glycosyl hydrolases family 2, TIM barrel domain